MPPLRVPADLVARAHADPLGDGPVLGHLLRERPLRAEGLVRRLRGERRVSGLRGAFSRGACVCSVWPIRDRGGETRRPAALFGVGRSAVRRNRLRRAQERRIRPTSVVCVAVKPLAAVWAARRAGGRAAAPREALKPESYCATPQANFDAVCCYRQLNRVVQKLPEVVACAVTYHFADCAPSKTRLAGCGVCERALETSQIRGRSSRHTPSTASARAARPSQTRAQ